MSLKDDWKDLENAVPGVPNSGSDINVDAINMIAKQAIENENFIKSKAETSDNKVTEFTNETANSKKYPTTEAVKRYFGENVKQPDYNQNDATQLDYIKNRPCKVEFSEDINETFIINYTEGEFDHYSEDKTLGLVAGNDYKILFKMYEGEDVAYEEEINVTAEYGLFETIDFMADISNKTLNIEYIEIEDNTLAAMATGKSIGVGWVSVCLEDDTIPFDKIEVTITGKGKHPTVDYLPSYFIEDGAICAWHLDTGAKFEIAEYLKKKGIFATSEDVEHEIAESLVPFDELKIKNKVSGSMLTLPDSAEQPFKSMKVFGKTKQFSTTGKNLLPRSYEECDVTSRYGVAITINNDGSILLNGTSTSSQVTNLYLYFGKTLTLPAGDYKIGGIASPDCYIVVYDPTISDYRTTKNNKVISLTLTEETQVKVLIQWTANAVIKNALVKPFIVKAEEYDGVWEPYTGGMPSPNPNYPQALESVGDSGSVEQVVKGGNLFNGFSVLKNTTFTDGIVSQITADDNPHPLFKVQIINKDSSVINVVLNIGLTLGVKAATFTKDDNSKYLVFGVNGKSRDTTSGVDIRSLPNGIYRWVCNVTNVTQGGFSWTDCMIIPDSITDNTYEPFKQSQSLTIPTPNGLPGVPVSSGGNYTDENGQQWICDEVDFGRGVYVQRVRKRTFNGGEAWTYATAGKTRFMLTLDDAYVNDGQATIKSALLCNQYVSATANEVYQGNNKCVITKGVLWVSDTNYVSVDDWKNHLSETNLTIVYQLAEPIETPLSAEEIEAYKALHTNYPVTTIYNNDGAGTEVEYVADTKNYVDNKIASEVAKLTAAIITE